MQMKLIRRAASYPQVARIFVHPAIKKALCEHGDRDRQGHAPGSARCGRGGTTTIISISASLARPGWTAARTRRRCRATMAAGRSSTNWYAMLKKAAIEAAKPVPPAAKPWTGKPPLTMAQLPKECGTVLTAGGFEPPVDRRDWHEPTPAALKAMAAQGCRTAVSRCSPRAAQGVDGAKTDKTATAGGADMPLPDRNPVR